MACCAASWEETSEGIGGVPSTAAAMRRRHPAASAPDSGVESVRNRSFRRGRLSNGKSRASSGPFDHLIYALEEKNQRYFSSFHDYGSATTRPNNGCMWVCLHLAGKTGAVSQRTRCGFTQRRHRLLCSRGLYSVPTHEDGDEGPSHTKLVSVDARERRGSPVAFGSQNGHWA